MKFHKEGRVSITIAVIVGFILIYLGTQTFGHIVWLKLLLVLLALFILISILQFFRKPDRSLAALHPDLVYAPADGKIVAIEEVEETEYLKRKCIQVSIFMSPLNVHINWNPVSGIVKYFKYHPGRFLVAWHPKSSTDNERTTVGVQTKNGTDVLYRQIAGAMARRIVWYVDEGDEVTQGQEFGFIKFGSRVDIFLPTTSEVRVNLNEEVRGNRSIIAEI
ncbi:phosphatidylserine decarboxylase family protein [Salibacter halophilus]|uniref:Phosphatidylserine decarboxylase family protein n=1 Tax=Salibacter halophilus TaxID=1803916 RepID=A0A6N6M8F5_9FLAO|nr:phosphatidylserine decarboxylase family protein [Salibacter halophilus]KAB1066184.1 phosphatidylserine decarboxylase family protein [Salibacter halophilus]